ncbi:hypothetical protein CYMTET_38751 [Cymbomonas tetramitiformis]|uniref:Calx-beta domain-containing protein n=1 Tax=Cymbomonas tetramitiformis TaxID=36881 RepID=A0AAE0CBF5_9CHLO|nr:hypothetical protein CYMTET_38751 [Cymbomonas tetramitiformis]
MATHKAYVPPPKGKRVGFTKRVYKVSEDDKQVEVNITRSKDQLGSAAYVLVETRDGIGEFAALAGQHYGPALKSYISFEEEELVEYVKVGIFKRQEVEPLTEFFIDCRDQDTGDVLDTTKVVICDSHNPVIAAILDVYRNDAYTFCQWLCIFFSIFCPQMQILYANKDKDEYLNALYSFIAFLFFVDIVITTIARKTMYFGTSAMLMDIFALMGTIMLNSWMIKTFLPDEMTGANMWSYAKQIWVWGHIMRTMKMGLLLAKFADLTMILAQKAGKEYKKAMTRIAQTKNGAKVANDEEQADGPTVPEEGEGEEGEGEEKEKDAPPSKAFVATIESLISKVVAISTVVMVCVLVLFSEEEAVSDTSLLLMDKIKQYPEAFEEAKVTYAWPADLPLPSTQPSMEEIVGNTSLVYLMVQGVMEWDYIDNLTVYYQDMPLDTNSRDDASTNYFRNKAGCEDATEDLSSNYEWEWTERIEKLRDPWEMRFSGFKTTSMTCENGTIQMLEREECMTSWKFGILQGVEEMNCESVAVFDMEEAMKEMATSCLWMLICMVFVTFAGLLVIVLDLMTRLLTPLMRTAKLLGTLSTAATAVKANLADKTEKALGLDDPSLETVDEKKKKAVKDKVDAEKDKGTDKEPGKSGGVLASLSFKKKGSQDKAEEDPNGKIKAFSRKKLTKAQAAAEMHRMKEAKRRKQELERIAKNPVLKQKFLEDSDYGPPPEDIVLPGAPLGGHFLVLTLSSGPQARRCSTVKYSRSQFEVIVAKPVDAIVQTIYDMDGILNLNGGNVAHSLLLFKAFLEDLFPSFHSLAVSFDKGEMDRERMSKAMSYHYESTNVGYEDSKLSRKVNQNPNVQTIKALAKLAYPFLEPRVTKSLQYFDERIRTKLDLEVNTVITNGHVERFTCAMLSPLVLKALKTMDYDITEASLKEMTFRMMIWKVGCAVKQKIRRKCLEFGIELPEGALRGNPKVVLKRAENVLVAALVEQIEAVPHMQDLPTLPIMKDKEQCSTLKEVNRLARTGVVMMTATKIRALGLNVNDKVETFHELKLEVLMTLADTHPVAKLVVMTVVAEDQLPVQDKPTNAPEALRSDGTHRRGGGVQGFLSGLSQVSEMANKKLKDLGMNLDVGLVLAPLISIQDGLVPGQPAPSLEKVFKAFQATCSNLALVVGDLELLQQAAIGQLDPKTEISALTYRALGLVPGDFGSALSQVQSMDTEKLAKIADIMKDFDAFFSMLSRVVEKVVEMTEKKIEMSSAVLMDTLKKEGIAMITQLRALQSLGSLPSFTNPLEHINIPGGLADILGDGVNSGEMIQRLQEVWEKGPWNAAVAMLGEKLMKMREDFAGMNMGMSAADRAELKAFKVQVMKFIEDLQKVFWKYFERVKDEALGQVLNSKEALKPLLSSAVAQFSPEKLRSLVEMMVNIVNPEQVSMLLARTAEYLPLDHAKQLLLETVDRIEVEKMREYLVTAVDKIDLNLNLSEQSGSRVRGILASLGAALVSRTNLTPGQVKVILAPVVEKLKEMKGNARIQSSNLVLLTAKENYPEKMDVYGTVKDALEFVDLEMLKQAVKELLEMALDQADNMKKMIGNLIEGRSTDSLKKMLSMLVPALVLGSGTALVGPDAIKKMVSKLITKFDPKALQDLVTSIPDMLTKEKFKEAINMVQGLLLNKLAGSADMMRPILTRVVDTVGPARLRMVGGMMADYLDDSKVSVMISSITESLGVETLKELVLLYMCKLMKAEQAREFFALGVAELASTKMVHIISVLLSKMNLNTAAAGSMMAPCMEAMQDGSKSGTQAVKAMMAALSQRDMKLKQQQIAKALSEVPPEALLLSLNIILDKAMETEEAIRMTLTILTTNLTPLDLHGMLAKVMVSLTSAGENRKSAVQHLLTHLDLKAVRQMILDMPSSLATGRIRELMDKVQEFLVDKVSSALDQVRPMIEEVVNDMSVEKLQAFMQDMLKFINVDKVDEMVNMVLAQLPVARMKDMVIQVTQSLPKEDAKNALRVALEALSEEKRCAALAMIAVKMEASEATILRAVGEGLSMAQQQQVDLILGTLRETELSGMEQALELSAQMKGLDAATLSAIMTGLLSEGLENAKKLKQTMLGLFMSVKVNALPDLLSTILPKLMFAVSPAENMAGDPNLRLTQLGSLLGMLDMTAIKEMLLALPKFIRLERIPEALEAVKKVAVHAGERMAEAALAQIKPLLSESVTKMSTDQLKVMLQELLALVGKGKEEALITALMNRIPLERMKQMVLELQVLLPLERAGPALAGALELLEPERQSSIAAGILSVVPLSLMQLKQALAPLNAMGKADDMTNLFQVLEDVKLGKQMKSERLLEVMRSMKPEAIGVMLQGLVQEALENSAKAKLTFGVLLEAEANTETLKLMLARIIPALALHVNPDITSKGQAMLRLLDADAAKSLLINIPSAIGLTDIKRALVLVKELVEKLAKQAMHTVQSAADLVSPLLRDALSKMDIARLKSLMSSVVTSVDLSKANALVAAAMARLPVDKVKMFLHRLTEKLNLEEVQERLFTATQGLQLEHQVKLLSAVATRCGLESEELKRAVTPALGLLFNAGEAGVAQAEALLAAMQQPQELRFDALRDALTSVDPEVLRIIGQAVFIKVLATRERVEPVLMTMYSAVPAEELRDMLCTLVPVIGLGAAMNAPATKESLQGLVAMLDAEAVKAMLMSLPRYLKLDQVMLVVERVKSFIHEKMQGAIEMLQPMVMEASTKLDADKLKALTKRMVSFMNPEKVVTLAQHIVLHLPKDVKPQQLLKQMLESMPLEDAAMMLSRAVTRVVESRERQAEMMTAVMQKVHLEAAVAHHVMAPVVEALKAQGSPDLAKALQDALLGEAEAAGERAKKGAVLVESMMAVEQDVALEAVAALFKEAITTRDALHLGLQGVFLSTSATEVGDMLKALGSELATNGAVSAVEKLRRAAGLLDAEGMAHLLKELPSMLLLDKVRDIVVHIKEFLQEKVVAGLEVVNPMLSAAISKLDPSRIKVLLFNILSFVDPHKYGMLLGKLVAMMPQDLARDLVGRAMDGLNPLTLQNTMLQSAQVLSLEQQSLAAATLLARVNVDKSLMLTAVAPALERLRAMGDDGRELAESLVGALESAGADTVAHRTEALMSIMAQLDADTMTLILNAVIKQCTGSLLLVKDAMFGLLEAGSDPQLRWLVAVACPSLSLIPKQRIQELAHYMDDQSRAALMGVMADYLHFDRMAEVVSELRSFIEGKIASSVDLLRPMMAAAAAKLDLDGSRQLISELLSFVDRNRASSLLGHMVVTASTEKARIVIKLAVEAVPLEIAREQLTRCLTTVSQEKQAELLTAVLTILSETLNPAALRETLGPVLEAAVEAGGVSMRVKVDFIYDILETGRLPELSAALQELDAEAMKEVVRVVLGDLAQNLAGMNSLMVALFDTAKEGSFRWLLPTLAPVFEGLSLEQLRGMAMQLGPQGVRSTLLAMPGFLDQQRMVEVLAFMKDKVLESVQSATEVLKPLIVKVTKQMNLGKMRNIMGELSMQVAPSKVAPLIGGIYRALDADKREQLVQMVVQKAPLTFKKQFKMFHGLMMQGMAEIDVEGQAAVAAMVLSQVEIGQGELARALEPAVALMKQRGAEGSAKAAVLLNSLVFTEGTDPVAAAKHRFKTIAAALVGLDAEVLGALLDPVMREALSSQEKAAATLRILLDAAHEDSMEWLINSLVPALGLISGEKLQSLVMSLDIGGLRAMATVVPGTLHLHKIMEVMARIQAFIQEQASIRLQVMGNLLQSAVGSASPEQLKAMALGLVEHLDEEKVEEMHTRVVEMLPADQVDALVARSRLVGGSLRDRMRSLLEEMDLGAMTAMLKDVASYLSVDRLFEIMATVQAVMRGRVASSVETLTPLLLSSLPTISTSSLHSLLDQLLERLNPMKLGITLQGLVVLLPKEQAKEMLVHTLEQMPSQEMVKESLSKALLGVNSQQQLSVVGLLVTCMSIDTSTRTMALSPAIDRLSSLGNDGVKCIADLRTTLESTSMKPAEKVKALAESLAMLDEDTVRLVMERLLGYVLATPQRAAQLLHQLFMVAADRDLRWLSAVVSPVLAESKLRGLGQFADVEVVKRVVMKMLPRLHLESVSEVRNIVQDMIVTQANRQLEVLPPLLQSAASSMDLAQLKVLMVGLIGFVPKERVAVLLGNMMATLPAPLAKDLASITLGKLPLEDGVLIQGIKDAAKAEQAQLLALVLTRVKLDASVVKGAVAADLDPSSAPKDAMDAAKAVLALLEAETHSERRQLLEVQFAALQDKTLVHVVHSVMTEALDSPARAQATMFVLLDNAKHEGTKWMLPLLGCALAGFSTDDLKDLVDSMDVPMLSTMASTLQSCLTADAMKLVLEHVQKVFMEQATVSMELLERFLSATCEEVEPAMVNSIVLELVASHLHPEKMGGLLNKIQSQLNIHKFKAAVLQLIEGLPVTESQSALLHMLHQLDSKLLAGVTASIIALRRYEGDLGMDQVDKLLAPAMESSEALAQVVETYSSQASDEMEAALQAAFLELDTDKFLDVARGVFAFSLSSPELVVGQLEECLEKIEPGELPKAMNELGKVLANAEEEAVHALLMSTIGALDMEAIKALALSLPEYLNLDHVVQIMHQVHAFLRQQRSETGSEVAVLQNLLDAMVEKVQLHRLERLLRLMLSHSDPNKVVMLANMVLALVPKDVAKIVVQTMLEAVNAGQLRRALLDGFALRAGWHKDQLTSLIALLMCKVKIDNLGLKKALAPAMEAFLLAEDKAGAQELRSAYEANSQKAIISALESVSEDVISTVAQGVMSEAINGTGRVQATLMVLHEATRDPSMSWMLSGMQAAHALVLPEQLQKALAHVGADTTKELLLRMPEFLSLANIEELIQYIQLCWRGMPDAEAEQFKVRKELATAVAPQPST